MPNEVQRVQQLTPEQRAAQIEDLSMKFFVAASHTDGGTGRVFKYPVTAVAKMIREAEQAARQEEREACARVCEELFNEPRTVTWDEYPAAIRARGKK
jgi:hypothetical protein